eukprot:364976-Chlamydomonas_euryale.AAC.4
MHLPCGGTTCVVGQGPFFVDRLGLRGDRDTGSWTAAGFPLAWLTRCPAASNPTAVHATATSCTATLGQALKPRGRYSHADATANWALQPWVEQPRRFSSNAG